MFFKASRYKKLSNVVTIGKDGVPVESRSIRPLPEVPGEFAHTVAETDRLDHLAHRFYRRPVKWWRICDANPEFLSPLALLGQEPLITARFPVTPPVEPPPWYKILPKLSAAIGVHEAFIKESIKPTRKTVQYQDNDVVVNSETPEREVVVIFNGLNIETADIKTAIEEEGFTVAEPVVTDRLGKEIIIPPDTVG
jgi:hypothetical protein